MPEFNLQENFLGSSSDEITGLLKQKKLELSFLRGMRAPAFG
jgi:hypothetical protein